MFRLNISRPDGTGTGRIAKDLESAALLTPDRERIMIKP
jgi:hypothetical protein